MKCLSLPLLLSITCLNACSAAASLGIEDVKGEWTVADVVCDDCGNRSPEEIGTVIKLGSDKVLDPLGTDCTTAPDYQLLESTTATTFIESQKRAWPAIKKVKVTPNSTVLHGFITCDGGNLMQFTLLSNERALYYFEGGIVMVLKKDRR